MILSIRRAPGYFYNPITDQVLSNKSGELRILKPTKWRFDNGGVFDGWRLSIKGHRKNIRRINIHHYVDILSANCMNVFEEYHGYRDVCKHYSE